MEKRRRVAIGKRGVARARGKKYDGRCSGRGAEKGKVRDIVALRVDVEKRALGFFPCFQARGPEDIARWLLRDFGRLDREVFGVLVLGACNQIQDRRVISIGTVDQTLVHPREVFKEAILGSAVKIIAFHNHPSGDPRPSREDEEITRQMACAGRLLGIPLVDHVIVAGEGYFSFKEKGML